MLNEHTDDGMDILHASKSIPDQTVGRNIPSAPRCPVHGKYNLSCSTPLVREIEAVSRYALDTLGVRPGYIENLKRFKETVRPGSLCYTEYLEMLDRLAAYAETLQAGQRAALSTEQNDTGTQI